MSGQHHAATAPWWVRLTCWAVGHQPVRLGPRRWWCARCDRTAETPVGLP